MTKNYYGSATNATANDLMISSSDDTNCSIVYRSLCGFFSLTYKQRSYCKCEFTRVSAVVVISVVFVFVTLHKKLPLYNARARYHRAFKTLFPLFIVPERRSFCLFLYVYITEFKPRQKLLCVWPADDDWCSTPGRNCVRHKIAIQINGPSNSIKNGRRTLSCTSCFQSSIMIVFPVVLCRYPYRFSPPVEKISKSKYRT